MTTLYRDDVSGDVYPDDGDLYVFGVLAYGDLFAAVDVHEETLDDDPEAVADELHAQVDEWLEMRQQHNQDQAAAATVAEGGADDA